MHCSKEVTLKNSSGIVSPLSSNIKIHLIKVVDGGRGLLLGHIVVINKTGMVCERWNGETPANDTLMRLGIVTKKQMERDYAVSVCRKGEYIRSQVMLVDNSKINATQEHILTISDLWAEGEW